MAFKLAKPSREWRLSSWPGLRDKAKAGSSHAKASRPRRAVRSPTRKGLLLRCGKCTNRCEVEIGVLERGRIFVNKIYIFKH